MIPDLPFTCNKYLDVFTLILGYLSPSLEDLTSYAQSIVWQDGMDTLYFS